MAKRRMEEITIVLPVDTICWLRRYTRDQHQPANARTLGMSIDKLITPAIRETRKKWREKEKARKLPERSKEQP